MRKADNQTTILCRCHESGNLNILEPSGPVQACNGTALPLPLHVFQQNINKIAPAVTPLFVHGRYSDGGKGSLYCMVGNICSETFVGGK